ncbi:hypothetical protein CTheo_693 [Ceratobasidium theobromae]|uniref:Uncharacterized protein n=1 Tax=Ceratobasidium theobromae TaxID=1582974 RepID=A0A5N5QWD2_9AGAM|nr:hypothetical protein CTheo_693 [Ceratobasidium theobromae]
MADRLFFVSHISSEPDSPSLNLPPVFFTMAPRTARRYVQAVRVSFVQLAAPANIRANGSRTRTTMESSNFRADPRPFSSDWEHDPSAPDFLPYGASSSRSTYNSRSRSRPRAPAYAPPAQALHYNPNFYRGQTYSEVEFDPEIDGQDPAPDSPVSDRSRSDSHRSEQLFASNIDNGAASYVLEPPIPRTHLPARLRDDVSGRYWNAEGDSTDVSGVVFPAPFGVKLSGEAFYYPSAQSGRFMNRRGEYWAGGEA